jgi:hypothetical protein
VRLFARLGVTRQDGWARPAHIDDVPEAARKWLREHADTYRVRRYVPAD